jgi:hypothetical protein
MISIFSSMTSHWRGKNMWATIQNYKATLTSHLTYEKVTLIFTRKLLCLNYPKGVINLKAIWTLEFYWNHCIKCMLILLPLSSSWLIDIHNCISKLKYRNSHNCCMFYYQSQFHCKKLQKNHIFCWTNGLSMTMLKHDNFQSDYKSLVAMVYHKTWQMLILWDVLCSLNCNYGSHPKEFSADFF